MSASVIFVGIVFAWLMPAPFGPRNRGHSCAALLRTNAGSEAATRIAASIAFIRGVLKTVKESSTALNRFERVFLHRYSFETAGGVGQGILHAQTVQAGGGDKADAGGVFVEVSGVPGGGHRPAARKDEG